MPPKQLLEGVNRLLAVEGKFSVIFPYIESEGFITLAATFGLFPQQITHTRGNAQSELKHSMMLFARAPQPSYPIDILTIEKERGVYTEAYKALTKEFYLK